MIKPSDLPVLSRRKFFQLGALSVTGGWLAPLAAPLRAATAEKVEPRGSADCVIFVNMVGGPSQMDTFDLKESKTTPGNLDIRTTKQGWKWPYGLLPQTAEVLDELVIVRSMGAWESTHNLAQYWQQVGHGFSSARAKELPSIGSVIAYEWKSKVKDSDFLPPFVSMNFPGDFQNGFLLGEGYLDSVAAPLAMDLRNGLDLPFLLPEAEQSRYDRRMEFLKDFDTARKIDPAWAPKRYLEWEAFTRGAHKMLKSPDIGKVFELAEEERKRYGGNPFGDACLIARNMVKAEAGVRYILLNQGGWDHHAHIYGAGEGEDPDPKKNRTGGVYALCSQFDRGFANLVRDLKATRGRDGNSTLLDRTFVVALGEFGRTPGPLNGVQGRDHWASVRCGAFAGGGIRHPGRVMGATDEQAAQITKFDWHKNRPIYPEDLSATIYSVLGIDWTKSLSGTPSGRDFVYVEPMSGTKYIGSTEVSDLFA
jgi:hypothetical protein